MKFLILEREIQINVSVSIIAIFMFFFEGRKKRLNLQQENKIEGFIESTNEFSGFWIFSDLDFAWTLWS